MYIHGTKKLLDKVKQHHEVAMADLESGGLFSWHANLIKLRGRQSVLLVNDKSLYVIVLYGLRAKDFSQLDTLIKDAIRTVWFEEGVKEDVIEAYLEQAGEVFFGKTNDRKFVARMTQACKEAPFYESEMEGEDVIQIPHSLRLSWRLVGMGNSDYFKPAEALLEELQAFSHGDVLSVRAAEMDVRLMLGEQEVWRRLMVPLNRTFWQFHEILQAAFAWWDYHLHSFYLFGNEKLEKPYNVNHPAYTEEGAKPVVKLVPDEMMMDGPNEGVPVKLEKGVKLSEFLPEIGSLVYVYDFGDDWRHRIDVLRVVEDSTVNHPVCLDGRGDAPPEDVGGESGYVQFLEIMNDEEHPDHTHMKEWLSGQLYQRFDLDLINRMLDSR
ncbi:hypothetical protein JNUCC1_00770 [Lentibacillus sp. JNUCC-1]|uniref:plasmid pRiA4b ORF-3 family protein n=1 Tax=Lentibacillus sp. JNUCC-1 TaxID=2654513 RepID=UPI0012E893FD|nr:plasmid pRiA4b ORF-3 family protein [Lentibacillus sp. JNUCC-1]MUV36964.1 hypothetical protein [Lentibacillus sp. JNUCC-1]